MKISNISHQQEKLQILLRRIRQDKEIRQIELAEKLGVPQSFVSKYESGERRLDILEIRQICKKVGISIDDFVRQLEETLNETK